MLFSTTLPVMLYSRPAGLPAPLSAVEWQEVDRGPGKFQLDEALEYRLRIKTIGDSDLSVLVKELAGLTPISTLDLSENRNITDDGMKALSVLTHLRRLNLSSCSLTNPAMDWVAKLEHLEELDLSYCNRLSDLALKPLRKLSRLQKLNLQGCVKITNGGVAHLRRRGLEIHVK